VLFSANKSKIKKYNFAIFPVLRVVQIFLSNKINGQINLNSAQVVLHPRISEIEKLVYFGA
jgi:hypothetical protein